MDWPIDSCPGCGGGDFVVGEVGGGTVFRCVACASGWRYGLGFIWRVEPRSGGGRVPGQDWGGAAPAGLSALGCNLCGAGNDRLRGGVGSSGLLPGVAGQDQWATEVRKDEV